MKLLALTLVLGSLVTAGACDSGSGDDIQPIDATTEGDAPSVDGNGGIDAPGACVLPSAPVTCTVGNDAPCAAMCANSICHNFNQVGVVCTQPCSPGGSGQCPTGWSCNNMGICRPPG